MHKIQHLAYVCYINNHHINRKSSINILRPPPKTIVMSTQSLKKYCLVGPIASHAINIPTNDWKWALLACHPLFRWQGCLLASQHVCNVVGITWLDLELFWIQDCSSSHHTCMYSRSWHHKRHTYLASRHSPSGHELSLHW